MSSDAATVSHVVNGDRIGAVIEPETVAELLDVLADSALNQGHLILSGGGTRLAYGNHGGPFDAMLSTRRLNRIIQYEPDDMTIAVEPGCTIEQIHELLRQGNQSLALDVAHPGSATIGGSFATGLSGPRRLDSGSLKDWVIGIDVAGPTGIVATAGGMVVKNVTGYDMMHVHYGALGAYGVITRLNLKVFPAPSSSRSLRFTYHSAADAYLAGIAVLTSQLQPSSILISCQSESSTWHLHIRCDAPENSITGLCGRISTHIRNAVLATDERVTEDGGHALAAFVETIDLLRNPCVARLSVTASRQQTVVERLITSGHASICADLGSGLVYVAIHSNTLDTISLAAPQLIPTFLAAPPELKADRDVFGSFPDSAGVIARRMKDTFDPDRRFNRGRFVLGL